MRPSLATIARVITLGVVPVFALAHAARADTDSAIVSLPAENFGFLPFYVAQDAKLFEEQGLAVKKIVLAGVGTTNGVISGAADFGFSNGASLTRAAARGQRLLGIAIMSDKPAWAIVMRKEITEAKHFDPKAPLAERAKVLIGTKAFGIDTVNSVGHGLLRVVEKAGGIDPESIPVTPLAASDAAAVFSRKGIDGFVSNVPWTEQVLLTGTAVIIADALAGDPSWLTPFGSGVVIARPQYCTEQRAICMKMGHALVAGVKFIHEHHAESLAILKNHFPTIDPGVLERSFQVIEKAMPLKPEIVETAIANSDRLNVEAGFMKPEEQLSSYKELFTNEFLR